MAMHTDPVCGMQVDDEKAAERTAFQASTFYFCSPACKVKFDEKPQQYATEKVTTLNLAE